MRTIFLFNLNRQKGAILGWGLGLGILALYLVSFYDVVAEQQEALDQLLSQFPVEIMAFLGELSDMLTPHGFLNIEFYSYMPLILGIFAISAGSGMLVSDEESGTLDLILAHPVKRTALFFGRYFAFSFTMFLILAIIWGCFLLGQGNSSIDFTPFEMAQPLLSLCALLFLFNSLAMFLSMTLPARRLASWGAGLLLVASFFINILANLDEKLEFAANFSPIKYYQGGEALIGLNWNWFLGLIVISFMITSITWRLFLKRDIRVGGEGSWEIPFIGKWRTRRLNPKSI